MKLDNAARVISLQAAGFDSPRRVYKYSVVPGGVQSPAELTAAAERDPVVSGHYRDIELSKVKRAYLHNDQRAYVSYRMKDHVYWTRTKVQLHKGELVLTDGRNLVRGRCGNRISFTPVVSSPGPEPIDPQFDIDEPRTFPVAFGAAPVPAASTPKDTPPAAGFFVPPAAAGKDVPQPESARSNHILPLLAPAAVLIGSSIAREFPNHSDSASPTTNPTSLPPGNPKAPGSGTPAPPPGSSPSVPPNTPVSGLLTTPPPVTIPVVPITPPPGIPVTVAPEPSGYAWLLCIGLGWLLIRPRRKATQRCPIPRGSR